MSAFRYTRRNAKNTRKPRSAGTVPSPGGFEIFLIAKWDSWKTRRPMGKIKAWLWKTFLRIGHDLTWKVEGWFQDQEIKLRRIEGEHEVSDAEYRQNGDHQ